MQTEQSMSQNVTKSKRTILPDEEKSYISISCKGRYLRLLTVHIFSSKLDENAGLAGFAQCASPMAAIDRASAAAAA